jgi:cysteine sulfinate desulfinase/cysteine desulfurase-like protein
MKISKHLLEMVKELESGSLSLPLVIGNLKAYAEGVDTLENEHNKLRAACNGLFASMESLNQNAEIMFHLADARQKRPVDGRTE